MTDPKFRSFTITHGVPRSPNRSMLRAIGYSDADFDKPIVGIANGHSTMNPCNAGIQPLGRRGRRGGARGRRHAADVRHHHRDRRHLDGHRGHEVLARLARGDRRRDRDRDAEPVHGRRARHRRLRQEPARRDDRHHAHERPRDLRLRRHHQARQPQGPGPADRLGVRVGGRVQRRQDVEGRLRVHRAQGAARRGRVRRHVHRQHDVAPRWRPSACRCRYSSTMAAEDEEKRESAAESMRVLVDGGEEGPEAHATSSRGSRSRTPSR